MAVTQRVAPIAVAMGFSIVLLSAGNVGAQQMCPVPSSIPDPAMPLNYPDRYAWELFVEVSRRAEAQQTLTRNDGSTFTTNSALWEAWPDDPYTFPDDPDPQNPPLWPESAALKTLSAPAFAAHLPAAFILDTGEERGEEVHRNRATFDFIIDNNLWYTEGVAIFYAANDQVTFPRDSVEVKANWVEIDEADKASYHWNYDREGTLFGLVAMHITSKALPNWFWATFEWVGNKGRCDFIGCRDCFGFTPPHEASHTDQLAQTYPPGEMTPELAALFEQGGLTGAWGGEWSNYRLKGSQTDFVDSTGVPLLLGNSITEGGFVQTASCITCHARAAVTSEGTNALLGFGQKQQLPLQNKASLALQTQYTTYNGAPDPNWFWAFLATEQSKVNLQMDFVWAIPFQAKPAKKGTNR